MSNRHSHPMKRVLPRHQREANKRTVAQLQAACDHEFETHDDSFSHEFGTEIIVYTFCAKCGSFADVDHYDHYHDEY